MKKTTYKYVYGVEAMDGEEIKGSFDETMLKAAKREEVGRVQVLKRRTVRGSREVFVHWDGYTKEHDQWIKEDDLR